MDKIKALETAKIYANEVRKIFNPISIIMFGSYVNGTPHKYSDIDIAVVFENYAGNWLKDSSLLWKLTRDTNTNIEPILVDIANSENSFIEEILKTGIVI